MNGIKDTSWVSEEKQQNPRPALHLDKQSLSQSPPPAFECQMSVAVYLEVTRERWLDSCLEPRLVFLSHICCFRGAPPAALKPHGAEVGAWGGRTGTDSAHREREMSPSILPWGKARSWGVCGAVHSPGMYLGGCKNNPCFPAQRCLVPFNQFDVPNFSELFLALRKKDSLPP